MPLDNPPGNFATVGEELTYYLDRVERLEIEVAEIKQQIKDVWKNAAGRGFDVKVLRQMLKERKLGNSELEEWLAICETYRAALGMLGGTPLGLAARNRFARTPDDTVTLTKVPSKGRGRSGNDDEAPEDPGPALPFDGEATAPAEQPAPAEPAGPSPEDVAAARAEGGQAATDGKAVLDNPYPALDPRRAAWDEGFCSHAGTDGMDIPAAYRRKPKPKGSGKGGDDSGAGGED